MTEQHPLDPPQELVQEWISQWLDGDISEPYAEWFAARSAQWGADGELEACRQWLEINGAPRELIDGLLAARRPKPPSLKREALEAMQEMRIEPCIIDGVNVNAALQAKYDIVILALEQLNG